MNFLDKHTLKAIRAPRSEVFNNLAVWHSAAQGRRHFERLPRKVERMQRRGERRLAAEARPVFENPVRRGLKAVRRFFGRS